MDDIHALHPTSGFDHDRTQSHLEMNRRAVTESFRKLVNQHGLEQDSDTPDDAIAEYLYNCLHSFNVTARQRKIWGGPAQ